MSDFKWEPTFEEAAFKTVDMRNLVMATCVRLTRAAIDSAPATKKSNWNKIKKNISSEVNRDQFGWYGNVVVEDNPRVRHAFLQERGWTDRAGRRHPGRWYLKRALERGRQ